MKLSALRVALRIARRDALRAKGRSALVLAMIALPVLGVAGVDVVYRSATLTPAETATRLLGRADLLLSFGTPGRTVAQAPNAEDGRSENGPGPGTPLTPEQQRSSTTDPADLAGQLLPAGSVLTPIGFGSDTLATTVDGLVRAHTTEADLTDPVWQGKVDVVRGRAPAAAREIAVTQSFLDSSGLKVGGTTTLRDVAGKPFTITGVAEFPDELKVVQIVGRPGELFPSAPDGAKQHVQADRWLVRLPAGAPAVDWAKVQELNRYAFAATSRSVLIDPPPRSAVPYYVQHDRFDHSSSIDRTAVVVLGTVAGMALLEIVLLAGPAFAVGARRSRRQLGLLAAGGGDRGHVRAVVLGGGVVLGVAGAAVGVVLAVLLVVLTRPWSEPLAGRRFGHLTLMPLDLLGIVAVGLVTGLLAAVVPAVQASRQDVVAALTGRGGVKPPSGKLAVLGLLMVAAGAALALYGATSGFSSRTTAVLGGSMIAELGMVACTPMAVGLFGRIGRLLPLGPRLALRDSVRHRGRTAPAVAAVMAAVAGSVAVGIYTTSSAEEGRQEYVATVPQGTVTLGAGYGASAGADLLAAQRAAVERSIPELGPRADIQSVDYRGSCRLGGSTTCGEVHMEFSADLHCPVSGPPGGYAADPAGTPADPRCSGGMTAVGGDFGVNIAGDPAALAMLFDVRDPAVVQAVTQGKVLVFDTRFVKDGKVTLKLTEPYPRTQSAAGGPQAEPAGHEVTADAVVLPRDAAEAQLFMTPQTAVRLGMSTSDAGSAWLPATAPSSAAEQKATLAVSRTGGDNWNFHIERGYRPVHTLVALGLTAFAALVALGAAGIATGLASADSQQDLTTLAAVGAAPRIRRTLSGMQCGVIAAMGAVLGTVCGIVPAVALRKVVGMGSYPPGYVPAHPTHMVLAFPWLTMGLTLVVLPLLAVLLAMALTRSKITLLRSTG